MRKIENEMIKPIKIPAGKMLNFLFMVWTGNQEFILFISSILICFKLKTKLYFTIKTKLCVPPHGKKIPLEVIAPIADS